MQVSDTCFNTNPVPENVRFSVISISLSRMLLVVERYPELKANQNFLALQSQLEGTENRIAVARKDYIEAVFSLNSGLRQFPAGWLARTFGHIQTKASFSANPQADQVPEVAF